MRAKELFRVGSISITPRKIENRALFLASVFLLLLGIGYVIHGSRDMFRDSLDYRMHWVEERYVFRGKNPADVFAQSQAKLHNKPIPNIGRDGSIDPDLGPADGAYPLWSYFTAAFFTWPPTLQGGRFYNGILNLIALAGLALWTYRLGEREGPGIGFFFTASFLAVSSVSTTFVVGQYGVQVLAALVALFLLSERNHWLSAGVCLGIAMVKLSVAAPFALPFMVKGRWRLLFVAGGYLVIGTLLIWPLVKTNPIEVFQQMTVSAEHYENRGYSLNNLFEKAGMPTQSAMRLAAVAVMGLAALLLYAWRSASLLTLYAIAGVASRAWCYHRQYDNVILVFLLLALGVTAWRTQNRLVAGFYLLVGVSLWGPGRLTDVHVWEYYQWVTWVAGLAVLLYFQRAEIRPAMRNLEGVKPAAVFAV